jgi:DNA-binding response OmpR family regulator
MSTEIATSRRRSRATILARARSTSRSRREGTVKYSVPTTKLLIVENHKELAQTLANELEGAGYASDVIGTVAEARAALETGDYAALIVNFDPSDRDELALLYEIRRREEQTPVIVVSARDSVYDRLDVLHSGGTDDLARPFVYEELVARLETIRRRGRRRAPLQIANLAFDPLGRRAFIDQQQQMLSPRQGEVLELLIRQQGRVVSRQLVARHLFGKDSKLASNAIDVYVHQLRRKLIDNGAKVQIRSIRSVGYLMSNEGAHPLANLTINTTTRRLFIDERLQILSAREAEVLELLMRKPGRVVPKKVVGRRLFGHNSSTANTIEVYIHRLRKKLIESGANVQIRTIRGVGYLIAEEHGALFQFLVRRNRLALLS